MKPRPIAKSPAAEDFVPRKLAVLPLDVDREWRRRYGGKCTHELFSEQATATPDAPALKFCDRTLSYRQLDVHSESLARRLQSVGVRPGQIVAIDTRRSMETIVALLAVLKAGGAYLALDRESPPERLALMLADARPALILSQTFGDRALPAGSTPVLYLDQEIDLAMKKPLATIETNAVKIVPAKADPDDLAYVSFTSGSTGAPKGVCIPHRGIVRLVKEPDYVSISSSDVLLQFAPLSFDASTFEIWGGLLNGACLAIHPPHQPSLTDLGEFIEREEVTILWLTAGLFHQMADGHLHYLHKVRQFITGGNVLSVSHVAEAMRMLPRCRLVNGYGPTENTTFTCCHPIQSLPRAGETIPIGKPIARTYCCVLDESRQPVPPGISGELYVGGDGLARGYLASPELTARKFVSDPLSKDPEARLYRTGDRVRQLACGDYEFLGRMDRQVKVSGFRIELDEVEAVLSRHAAVREVAVQLRPAISGYEHLAAYLSLKTGAKLMPEELRDFARQRLPGYMIPSSFAFLAALPLNANGKLDQDALASLSPKQPTDTATATSTTEEALIGIWREVFGRDDFTTEQNFFDVGGTSLRATHLLARIQTVLGKSVPMNVLLKGATIAGLARHLDRRPSTTSSLVYPFRTAGSRPALFCLPSQAGDLVCYANLERHFARDRPVYGVQSRSLFGEEEGDTIEEIAASCRQTILRQQPDGPYHLFGYCFGGLLAYEVACQLWKHGAAVGLVAVLDYPFPDPDPRHSWVRRPSNLIHFLGNLGLCLREVAWLPRQDRAGVYRRLAMRLRGFLRGEGWNGALLKASPAENQTFTAGEQLYEIHERAWRQYVPHSFPGEVTLLRPRRLPVFRSHDPTLGWSGVCGERLRVRVVPGGGWHGASLKEPHAAALTRAIESCIVEAEQMPVTPAPVSMRPA